MDGYNEAMNECASSVADTIFDGIIESIKDLKNVLDYTDWLIVKDHFENKFGIRYYYK